MIRYDQSIAKYQMMQHVKEKPAEDRFDKILEGRLGAADEGLSTTNYSVISHVKRELYTHVLVAL